MAAPTWRNLRNAIKANDTEASLKLIAQAPHISFPGKPTVSELADLLHLAIVNGEHSVVRAKLKRYQFPEDVLYAKLKVSIEECDIQMVLTFLEFGAPTEKPASYKSTVTHDALAQAAIKQFPDGVSALLEHSKVADKQLVAALFWHKPVECPAVSNLLIEASSPIVLATALRDSVVANKSEHFFALLRAGANPNRIIKAARPSESARDTAERLKDGSMLAAIDAHISQQALRAQPARSRAKQKTGLQATPKSQTRL